MVPSQSTIFYMWYIPVDWRYHNMQWTQIQWEQFKNWQYAFVQILQDIEVFVTSSKHLYSAYYRYEMLQL